MSCDACCVLGPLQHCMMHPLSAAHALYTQLKEAELALAEREIARAEAVRGGTDAGGAQSPGDAALAALADEERELLARLEAAGPEARALFEAFVSRKRELEEEVGGCSVGLIASCRGHATAARRGPGHPFVPFPARLQEARLSTALAEHEETLAAVRARLAHPPASALPTDPAKAALYVAWKRALAERDELLRGARRRKAELLRDLKARHETQVRALRADGALPTTTTASCDIDSSHERCSTYLPCVSRLQVVLLEMERRSAIEGLRASVAEERAKVCCV